MKRMLPALLLLLCACRGFCADDKAYLGMFAETTQNKIAGMPSMPALPPGMDPKMLEKMPGLEEMMGALKRVFTIRLWSPGIAPDNAFAYVNPPMALKQGNKLDLELYRPKAEKAESGEVGPGESGAPGKIDFTIKYYWGSSPTVKPGQPKIFRMADLNVDQKRVMTEASKRARGGESYFFKPDWTTAYWPTSKQPGKIAKDASLVGTWGLTTNYTGNVTIDCPENVDFLAPIEMASPEVEQKIQFDKAIRFAWKAIPNLLGSHAIINGMEGKNTLVIWSSSEVWREDMMSVDWGFLQMADVRKFVQDTIMMSGDRTDVTVPAGIFKDCDFSSFRMTGYGPGVAREGTQPIPRIQTKTSLSIMLGGKAVPSPDEDTGQ